MLGIQKENFRLTALSRRKKLSDEPSKLARVLNLLDLTALGVGSTLGLGVYILAGSVSKTIAGPAVCISFAIAAIASAFAGLCYAEFASRVPKAGSAYIYSYVTVGEFVAYIIGWNLIMEYVLGTASVARGLSGYIDALVDYKIREEQSSWIHINVGFLADYPDFLSLAFVILITALLGFGVKESTFMNNIFTVLNLSVIVTVIISGSIKSDPANWTIENPPDGSEGGFAPWGISGIMAGAAKCFFGFVGFDSIATTGEEAKNPQRNIPLAIVISLVIIFFAYFGVSTVLTMMWPYYLQDADAPLPHVYGEVGWYTIKMIVTIGAIFALCTSLLGAMFPLPRVIYAMSSDGLIFNIFATVNERTKTPLNATILSGILSALMSTLFDLDQLVDMMSIGTLMAYTIVAVCVLILRYQPDDEVKPETEVKEEVDDSSSMKSFTKLMFNTNKNQYANKTTAQITNWSIGIFSIFAAAFCACIIYGPDYFLNPYFLTFFVIISLIMILLITIIARQPVVDPVGLAFKVPGIPYVPCLSVIINLYLMLELNGETWIRFIFWLLIGFLIYFFYGIHQSKVLKNANNKENTSARQSIEQTSQSDTKF